MIIDHHVHLGTDLKTNFTLTEEELLRKMDLYGIDKSLVFACPNLKVQPNPYQKANDKILKASRKNTRLIPFMFVHPFLDDPTYLNLEQNNFTGFKVYATAKDMEYSYKDLLSQEQMQILLHTKKPILFHTGKKPGARARDLLEVISATSQPIILAHSGRLYREDLEQVAKYDHVYIDISPLKTNIAIEKLLAEPEERDPSLTQLDPNTVINYLETLFQGRIVWGTDTPWCDHLIPNGYEQEIKIRKLLKNPNKTFLN